MLLEIIFATILGIFAGIFTGLIPGIHINLITTLLVSVSNTYLSFFSTTSLVSFIVSMSTTHSFLDVIPSTFLGAPDPENSLFALPAHKMLLKGRAYEAIRLTSIGSLSCLLISVISSPLVFLFIKFIYPFLSKNMFFILVITCSFLIFRNKKRLFNLSFFLLSGILGFIALNSKQVKEPLFPMLTGLFGLSILITSFFDKVIIPNQTSEYEEISQEEKIRGVVGGTIAGGLTSFLPGLGASQGAAIATSFFKSSTKSFMIMIGGINTVNFVLSIIAFLAIEKARNGSIIAITTLSKVDKNLAIILISIALISGSISCILSLRLTKIFSKFIQKINYQLLIIFIILLIITLVFIRTRFIGLILLFSSTALGILATKKEIGKNNLMGCILLPVIIYFCPF